MTKGKVGVSVVFTHCQAIRIQKLF